MPISEESIETQVHRLLTAFEEQFGGHEGAVVARAPGRVNHIGDHTDYNDGFVLPMTIDRDVFVAARKRPDGLIRLHSLNFGEGLQYEYDRRPAAAIGSWTSYVTGAVEELRLRDLLPGGFEMLIYGDVPLGAGLSSSAALEIAVAFGMQELFQFDLDPIAAVHLGQLVEHVYAGVRCGIMDQFASRLGRRGHALFLDCRSLEHEHVPLPLAREELALVIADSGVSRELAGSKYGERRLECERAVAVLRSHGENVAALRDATPAMLDEHNFDEVVYRRAKHVVDENDRVLKAREALRAGDYEAFGILMNDSHASLRDLFEVSCAELDVLVEAAQSLEGVLGARMTGGGFGGCTVTLVRQNGIQNLENRLAEVSGAMARTFVLRQNHQAEVLYRS